MDHDSKLLKEAYEKMPKPITEMHDLSTLEQRIAELTDALMTLKQNTERSIDNLNDRVDRLSY